MRPDAFGEGLSIEALARRLGLGANVIRKRLRHMPLEAALRLPLYGHYDPQAALGGPHSWTWDGLVWERDPWAQAFVDAHPDGASLEEVGDALGVTRERVRQIELIAMRKIQQLKAWRRLSKS